MTLSDTEKARWDQVQRTDDIKQNQVEFTQFRLLTINVAVKDERGYQ